jgi:SAM-dependent methyltransferase
MGNIFEGDTWKVRNEKLLKAILDRYCREVEEMAISVLELGCDHGAISKELYKLGITDITCSDVQQKYLDTIRRDNAALKTVRADLNETYQFSGYGLVLCLGVLYHLRNPKRTLENILNRFDNYLMIETEYVDSNDPNLVVGMIDKYETQYNGSNINIGIRPSLGMIECVLNSTDRISHDRVMTDKYNSQYHIYNSSMTNTGRFDSRLYRGIWFCERIF